MQANIRKIGNSEGTIIPAGLLRKLNLATGDKISIEEQDGKIVISASKPKYQLSELIAKCDLSAPMPEELEQWDRASPVGNEEW
ncbi:MAG: AbrB/MazE/SpoVT family DNA-binding domain-containing protein [Gammaproteobacteria bacterium]|jgi:antitoxin ChpS|nr:AbrB/MazE/SpoVT family DNA-binding domain-containing protein [Gammaproteobacteria bacterium]